MSFPHTVVAQATGKCQMYKRDLFPDTIDVPDMRYYKGMMKNIKMVACGRKYNFEFGNANYDSMAKRSRRFP